jgi:ABC-type transport system substrate-binding protein
MIGFDETLPFYEFNTAKAKQLVVEAGYPNGVDVTLSIRNDSRSQRIGEIVKNMWDAVGLRTTLDVMERLAWIEKLRNYDYQSAAWTSDTQLDSDLLSRYLVTGGVANWSGYGDPEMDKCMQEGGSTLEVQQREQVYKRCQRMIYDQAYIGTGYYELKNTVHHKRVNGIRVQFLLPDYREVWLSE